MADDIQLKPLPPAKPARDGMVTVTMSADDYPKLQAFWNSGAYEAAQAAKDGVIEAGLESIKVAMEWALKHDCSGAAVFARLLASLYNGDRVKMDASRLIFTLDCENFEHAMNVIRLCRATSREPHSFFVDGNRLFEQMIAQWGFEKKRKARS